MSTLLVVLVVAFVVVLSVVALRRSAANSVAVSDSGGQDWLERARLTLDCADRLTAQLPALHLVSQIRELDDDALGALADRLSAFCGDVAALTASAPTAMDARVTRNLGTRARALGDVYDRELRYRKVFDGGMPAAGPGRPADEVGDQVREFELAVSDLRSHVELL